LAYLLCGFDSIQAGKADVQQDQVWFKFAGFLNCFQSICAFADDLQFRVGLEQGAD